MTYVDISLAWISYYPWVITKTMRYNPASLEANQIARLVTKTNMCHIMEIKLK